MKKINLVLTITIFLFLNACSEQEVEEQFVRPVRSIVIETGASQATREFSGTAQTDRVIDLSFRSSGIITISNVSLGQQVNKGDLLAELDNVSARLAYEQAISSLNSEKSSFNTQKLALDRVRGLYEKGSASLSDFEAAKNQYQTAQASYRSAQRSVDIQQEQIRYGKIFAPETGVIAAVNNDINENISSGQTVIVLNAGTEMEIEVGLPESVINLVEFSTQASIRFSALPDVMYSGIVKEISPSLNQQTGTYPVLISLDSSDQQVRAGMAATVSLNLNSQGSDKLFVPAAAVGEDANGNYVFVLQANTNNNATVVKQKITLGQLVGNSFEITEGLQAGERIVTAGVHSVINGQKVLIRDQ